MGNVLSVITPDANNATQPAIERLTDYYPFGMEMGGRSYKSNDYRFGYTGHEKENDLAEGVYTTQYRLLDTRLGRWMSVDPLFGKYPDMSAYNYCGGNPVMMVDPDGSRVWFVLFVDDGSLFSFATKTKVNEIKQREDFNPKKDHIYIVKYSDLADLHKQVEWAINNANKKGYGKTVEVASYSHQGSKHGPIAPKLTSGTYSAGHEGPYQMNMHSWCKIDFNFDQKESLMVLYGCQNVGWMQRYMSRENSDDYPKGPVYGAAFGGKAMASYKKDEWDKPLFPDEDDNIWMYSYGGLAIYKSLTYEKEDYYTGMKTEKTVVKEVDLYDGKTLGGDNQLNANIEYDKIEK